MPRTAGRGAKRAADTILSMIGYIAIAVTAITACSARPYAAEAAGAVEEVEATPSLVREIQFMLSRLGMDPGPIDGIAGPQTNGAYHKFQQQSGLPASELLNGGRVSTMVLARLRSEASRIIFEKEKTPEAPPAATVNPPPAAPPPAPATVEKPDRFAAEAER